MEKTIKKYSELAEKYNIYTQDFLNEVLPIVSLAPYSDDYLNQPGGLIKHSLILSSKLSKVNDILPKNLRYPLDVILFTAFLNDIGRYDLFKIDDGKYVYANADGSEITLKPNHKSIYLINRYQLLNNFDDNTQLTINQAIINSNYEHSLDRQYTYYSEPLTHILRMALKLTNIEIKSEKK